MEDTERKSFMEIPFMEPEDEDRIIVSMIEFENKIYVATKKGIYIIKDDKLVRLKFKDS